MKRLLLPALLTTLLSPASAFADASATAIIDWDSFSVQLIDLSGGLDAPVFTWTSQYGEAYSYAYTPTESSYGGYAYAYDFSTPIASSSATSSSQASAMRDASTLFATSATQVGTNPWYLSSNSAYASTYNYGYFSLSGSGIALISMDWEASVSGATGDWNDYAYAYAGIWGAFSDSLYNSGSSSSNYSNYSADVGDVMVNGSFAMAVINNSGGGTTGYLAAQAYTFAYSPSQPVPEPESYALMLAGLGLLGWMQRRRSA